jgi:hypothetical protein
VTLPSADRTTGEMPRQPSEGKPCQVALEQSEVARDGLVAVLRYAIDVISRLNSIQRQWPEDSDKLETFTDKIVAETALLVLLASRVAGTDPCIQLAVDELAAHLSPHARSVRSGALMLRFPHTAATLGFGHVALQSAGYSDARFDEQLRRCLATGQGESIERVPFRSIELAWQYGLLGLPTQDQSADLLRFSILSKAPNPCFALREQAYQLTHAIMYATAFGDDSHRLEAYQPRLSQTIDAFLAWTVAVEDLDLVCELLIGLECARLEWSPAARIAAVQVWRTWNTFGYLPGVNFDISVHRSLSGPSAEAYAVQHIYHTNYVLGILCALIAGRTTRGFPDESEGDARPLDRHTELRHASELSELADRCERAVALAQPLSGREALLDRPGEDYAAVHKHRATESPPQRGRCTCKRAPSAAYGDAPYSRSNYCVNSVAPQLLEDVAAAPVCAQCANLFLLDCGLVVAARSYDLVRTARLLADVVESAAPPSAGAIAAIAFLVGQQLPGGAFGAHFLAETNLRSELLAPITQLVAVTLEVCAQYLRDAADIVAPVSGPA